MVAGLVVVGKRTVNYECRRRHEKGSGRRRPIRRPLPFSSLSFVSLPSPRRPKALQVTGYL